MQQSDWIWFDGKMVPWQDAKIHVLSHTLHYGTGAFEGIRFYKTDKGAAIFRLKEHVDRLIYSAGVIGIELPYTHQEIERAIIDTVRENGLLEGYIRPLVFLGLGDLRVSAKNSPTHLMVACWTLGNYLSAECADVKVSDFIRIHPQSTITDAKLCGHYTNSVVASLALKGTHYHESLLLDFEGNIAAGPGENFFCVIDGIFKTPPLGRILAGITRATIIGIIKALDFQCQEVPLTLEEAMNADEAFFTGTAVEVTPIRSINDMVLGDGNVGELTQKISQVYFEAITGKNANYDHYLTHV